GFSQCVLIIFFLMWVYRTFKNLIASKVAGLQHSAGWAVGSYIVPIVNLFIPYIVMKEVYQASLYAKPESEDWKTKKSPKYFLVWWIFYIVGSLLYNVNTMFSFDTMGDYQISAVITIIAEPMLILALISLFFIMRNITKAQDTTLVESMQVDEAVADKED